MSKTLLIAGIVFLFASVGFFMYKQLKNINKNQVHFHNRISEIEKRVQGLTTAIKMLAPPQPKQVQTPAQNQSEQEKDAEEKEIVIEEIDADKEKEE